jgi:hypothetical protein
VSSASGSPSRRVASSSRGSRIPVRDAIDVKRGCVGRRGGHGTSPGQPEGRGTVRAHRRQRGSR